MESKHTTLCLPPAISPSLNAIGELTHLFNKADDVVDPEAEYGDANKQYERCDLPPE
jgi:hypothetical protein